MSRRMLDEEVTSHPIRPTVSGPDSKHNHRGYVVAVTPDSTCLFGRNYIASAEKTESAKPGAGSVRNMNGPDRKGVTDRIHAAIDAAIANVPKENDDEVA